MTYIELYVPSEILNSKFCHFSTIPFNTHLILCIENIQIKINGAWHCRSVFRE